MDASVGEFAIHVKDLVVGFGRRVVIEHLSLDVRRGEILGLVGASGGGKSVLMRTIIGLIPRRSGEIEVMGARIGSTHDRGTQAAAGKWGILFQQGALFSSLTARQNIQFPLRENLVLSDALLEEIATAKLEMVGLTPEDGDKFPSELSGGMTKRVALARALAVEPELLLLDEPFGALDAQVRVTLRRWLRELHEELQLTTVFVTHDQEEALELADRIAVMNRGRIEQVGTPQAIYQDPATPFVCEFIGRTNRIPLTRHAQAWRAGAWSLTEDPWNGRHREAVAYVRPEHLALSVPDGEPAWEARVRHVYLAGSVAHLDLYVAGIDLALEADVASEDLGRLGLHAGAALRAAPARLVAFPCGDGDGSRPMIDERCSWASPTRR